MPPCRGVDQAINDAAQLAKGGQRASRINGNRGVGGYQPGADEPLVESLSAVQPLYGVSAVAGPDGGDQVEGWPAGVESQFTAGPHLSHPPILLPRYRAKAANP